MVVKKKGYTSLQTFSQNDYITHLQIPHDIRARFLEEFFEFESVAKKWEAKGHVLNMLDVIRNEDVEDCELANDVAWNISSIVGCQVYPRYYRQLPGTELRAHRDLNTECALNVILRGTSPITFDEKYDVLYDCALLNVQQTHSVNNQNERIFLKLSIFDRSYADVVDSIKGREDELFDI